MALNEYWIDADNGDDTTGSGASGAPWQTVQKAFDSGSLGTEGTNIYLLGGTTVEYTGGWTHGWTPTGTALLQIMGYETTAGDVPSTRSAMASVDGGSTACLDMPTGAYTVLSNMILHNDSTESVWDCGSYNSIFNCELYFDVLEGGNHDVIDNGTGFSMAYCYVHDWNRNVADSGMQVFGCLFVDETGDFGSHSSFGTFSSPHNSTIANSIFVKKDTGTSSTTITMGYGTAIHNCSFYNSANSTNDKCLLVTYSQASIHNCLFEGWSGTGNYLIGNSSPAVLIGNSYRDTATAWTSFSGNYSKGVVDNNESITGSVFTDAANGDFTPADLGNIIEGAVPLKIGGTGAP